MQTKFMSVTGQYEVTVWDEPDTFPEDHVFLAEFKHVEGLNPFGILYPQLQDHAIKTLREGVEDPSTVNIETVVIIKGYQDEFDPEEEYVPPEHNSDPDAPEEDPENPENPEDPEGGEEDGGEGDIEP